MQCLFRCASVLADLFYLFFFLFVPRIWLIVFLFTCHIYHQLSWHLFAKFYSASSRFRLQTVKLSSAIRAHISFFLSLFISFILIFFFFCALHRFPFRWIFIQMQFTLSINVCKNNRFVSIVCIVAILSLSLCVTCWRVMRSNPVLYKICKRIEWNIYRNKSRKQYREREKVERIQVKFTFCTRFNIPRAHLPVIILPDFQIGDAEQSIRQCILYRRL